MNDIQSYERLIKKRVEGKLLLSRIALIAGYVLFAVIGILLVILFANGHAALILLVAALDLCIFLTTWRFVNVEYEYAFVSGSFYLSKIFGKAARKELFECEISRALTVAPYKDQYKKDVERLCPDKRFTAISSNKAEDIWFILFESEGNTKTLVVFEADERSLKCLRHGAPRSIVKEKLTLTNNATEENNDA